MKFTPSVAVNAFGATTTGGTGISGTGRIFIDFPTTAFASDLGTGKTSGDLIPCKRGFATANQFNLLSGKELQCMLIESKYSGEPATIELLNFDSISVQTDGTYYEIAIATIKNPATEVTDV